MTNFTKKGLLEKDAISRHSNISDGRIYLTITDGVAKGVLSIETPLKAEEAHNIIPAIFRSDVLFSNVVTTPYICEVYKDTRYDADVDDLKLFCDPDYWTEIMKNKPDDKILEIRLVTIIKGFYLEHCLYQKQMPSHKGLVDFATNEDRCYGTKDMEAGILFNLGLDPAYVLSFSRMPEYMETFALALHEKAKKAIKADK